MPLIPRPTIDQARAIIPPRLPGLPPAFRPDRRVYVLDRQGRIIDTNQIFTSANFRRFENLIGSRFAEQLDPETAAALEPIIADPDASECHSLAGRCGDGEDRNPVTMTVFSLFGEDGAVVGFVVHLENPAAAETEKAEAELDLFSVIPEAALELDPELRVQRLNRPARELFQIETPGLDFSRLLAAGDSARILPLLELTRKGIGVNPVSADFRRPDGGRFRAELRFARAPGEGDDRLLVLIHRPESNPDDLQLALLLKYAFDLSREGIALLDHRGRILFANAAFAAAFGDARLDAIAGRSIAELAVSRRSRAPAGGRRDEVGAEGIPAVELTVIGKNGRVFPLPIAALTPADDPDEPLGFICKTVGPAAAAPAPADQTPDRSRRGGPSTQGQ